MDTIRELVGGILAVVSIFAFFYFIYKWFSNRRKGIKTSAKPILISFMLIIIAGVILPDDETEIAEEETEEIATKEEEKEEKPKEKKEEEEDTSKKEVKPAPKVEDTPKKEEPKEEPKNTAKDDMELFAQAVVDPSSKASQAMSSIGELFAQAGDNPMLIYDEQWILKTSVAMVLLEESGNDFKNINIQSEHQDVQEAVKEAHLLGDKLLTIRENIIAGVDQQDASKIQSAGNLMKETQKHSSQMTELVDKYNN